MASVCGSFPSLQQSPSFPSSQARSAASSSIALCHETRESHSLFLSLSLSLTSVLTLFRSLFLSPDPTVPLLHAESRCCCSPYPSFSIPVFLHAVPFCAQRFSSILPRTSLSPPWKLRVSRRFVRPSASLARAFASYARYKLVGRGGVFV